MIEDNLDNVNDEQTTTENHKPTIEYDVVDNDYMHPIDEEYTLQAKMKKHSIKSDVTSLTVNVLMNAIPIISKSISHRKENIPYRVEKKDIARLALGAVLPTIKVIDTAFMNKKIQNTMSEKLPFSFNDVQNVTNFIQMYKPLHTISNHYLDSIRSSRTGNVKTMMPEGTVKKLVISAINLAVPYVSHKLTDSDLSFHEKLNSVVPIGVAGGLIKKAAQLNPKTRQVYDVGTAVVQMASYGNKTLSNAVRSSPQSTLNKTSSTINGVLNVAQDLFGMRGGGYGGGYGGGFNNGYGPGSRWNGGGF